MVVSSIPKMAIFSRKTIISPLNHSYVHFLISLISNGNVPSFLCVCRYDLIDWRYKINDFEWDLKRIKLEKGIDDKCIYEDRWITTLDASWVYPTFFSRVSQMEWQILLVLISITSVTSTKFVFFFFVFFVFSILLYPQYIIRTSDTYNVETGKLLCVAKNIIKISFFIVIYFVVSVIKSCVLILDTSHEVRDWVVCNFFLCSFTTIFIIHFPILF